MPLGPIEILCVKFPTTAVTSGMVSALKALVDSRMIRIVDIVFIRKSASGEVTYAEVDEVDDVDHTLLDPLIADISGLIAEADVEEISQTLDHNSFAALMLFEHTWATAFGEAVLQAGGQLVMSDRIPSRVVDEALAAQAAR